MADRIRTKLTEDIETALRHIVEKQIKPLKDRLHVLEQKGRDE